MSEGDTSKARETNSEEEPTELEALLSKIEEAIVSSITRGIDRVAEESEGAEQQLMNFDQAILIADSLKTDIDKDSQRGAIVKPNFSLTRLSSALIWEITNPIVLRREPWQDFNNRGIQLDKGFYQIQYSGSSNSNEASGLALIEPETLKIDTVIVCKYFTQNLDGFRYVDIKTTKILTSFNFNGEIFEGHGIYVISIYKLKTLPN